MLRLVSCIRCRSSKPDQNEKMGTDMEALVSIIVPVYNVEAYLTRCIDSVQSQTYKNWELILVDDGSPDRSGEICDQYAQECRSITVIHQANCGVSAARNRGIEEAKGDYLLFVDPDDWIAPEMIETMLAEGKGAELVVCGFTDFYQYEDGTCNLIPNPIWTDHKDTFITTDPDYDVLCKTSIVWNKLFRRDSVGNIRFHPGLTYGEDSLFTASVLQNVHSAVLIPKPYYFYYRNRKGNVVSSKIDERSLQFLESALQIYDELRKRGRGSCGVFRIFLAVRMILAKIPVQDRKMYHGYVSECCRTLRKTDMRDRLRYLQDKRFGFILRRKIVYFFAPYSTRLLFALMKR